MEKIRVGKWFFTAYVALANEQPVWPGQAAQCDMLTADFQAELYGEHVKANNVTWKPKNDFHS